ncbi:MAG: hypothetical protein WBL55_12140 [Xanthobacteraceae bacterium]
MITFAGFSALQLGIRQAADVRRAKNGKPAAHPIRGDELRALRRIEWHEDKASIRAHLGGL